MGYFHNCCPSKIWDNFIYHILSSWFWNMILGKRDEWCDGECDHWSKAWLGISVHASGTSQPGWSGHKLELIIFITALGKSTTTSSFYSALPRFVSVSNYVSLYIVIPAVMELLSTVLLILGHIIVSSLTLSDSQSNWQTARKYLTKYGYDTNNKSLNIK